MKYKNVTEWINGNDDIGVLCREGVDVFYSYPIGGEYVEIKAPAFSDDEVEEIEDDFAPVVETMGWVKYNENMSTVFESKIHLTTDQGETILCGTKVPTEGDGFELGGDHGHKECKRCAKKA